MTQYSLDEAVAVTQEIASDVTAKEADRVDKEAVWPENTMRAVQRKGLAGLVLPVKAGGLGLGLLGLTRVAETLAAECASTGLCFGMHSVGAMVAAAKATPDHFDRYIEPIASGKHLTTLALSEPGTGLHFYYPETAMARDGDGYRVNGTKSFVTNGGHADSYVLSTVATEADAPPGHFSCIMVPNEGEGIEWGDPWHGLGMRGNSSRNLTLSDVKIPQRDLLGDEGDQIWYIFQVVAPFFLVAMAGTYLGIANRALTTTMEHLRQRTYSHSGTRLAEVDVLQHRLGRLWARVERTRRLTYWAAEEGDRGGPAALPGIMSSKAEVAHCAVDVVNDCMTLLGGQAYREGGIMERLLRDARAAHVMAPTTDILYTWTGRALLDLPLLAD